MEADGKRCKIPRRDASDGIQGWEVKLNSNINHIIIGNANVRTDAADTPPVPRVMLTADRMTCSEKPKGFLYSTTVFFEPDNGAKASCWVSMIRLRSVNAMDWMIYSKGERSRETAFSSQYSHRTFGQEG